MFLQYVGGWWPTYPVADICLPLANVGPLFWAHHRPMSGTM